jgi:hypothetical protein
MPSISEKPHRQSISFPTILLKIIDQRMREEGYKSITLYILALIIFDICAHRRHWLTSRMLNEPKSVQDRVLAGMVDDFHAGVKRVGGWYEHQLDEAGEIYRTEKRKRRKRL